MEAVTPLWKVVDDICGIVLDRPDSFNPENHLPLVGKIVEELDSLRGSSHFTLQKRSSEEGYEHYGEHTRRVGHYVARRFDGLLRHEIVLEQRQGRGEEDLFGFKRPSVFIEYRHRDYQVRKIGRIDYHVIVFPFGFIRLTQSWMKYHHIWRASPFFP